MDGEKFRTDLLVLFFDLPLRKETATKTALLAEVLKKHHWQDTARQAEEMYGALWDVSVVKKGDRQLLLFSLETLKNVDTEEAAAFLLQRIQNVCFDEKTVERQKAILKNKLNSLQDERKAFAEKRALEETAEGTAYALSAEGYAEDVELISADDLHHYYQNLLKNAEVKVFFCGGREEKSKVLSLRQFFSGKVTFAEQDRKEHAKNGPRFLQEHAEAEQARLIVGFSADVENERRYAALLLLHHLLGGAPDSLLFQKIREEKGLCYDIRSRIEPMSPFLFVQAGIRAENARETGKLVLKEVEGVKTGTFSAEKLQQAKENLMRKYERIADDPWMMVDFLAEQVLQGKPLTNEKLLQAIERTDMEDIRRAADHLELKVVYLLSKEEDEHDAK